MTLDMRLGEMKVGQRTVRISEGCREAAGIQYDRVIYLYLVSVLYHIPTTSYSNMQYALHSNLTSSSVAP